MFLFFLFFSFSPWERITQYIYMERKSTAIFAESKTTEIFAEPSFFLFRHLFLVMSYLSDRKRKWQTTAKTAETGSCLHEIWQGLCNQLWLISQPIIQEVLHTEPAWWTCIQVTSRDGAPELQVTRSRMAGQEVSQIVLLSFLCTSNFLWMRGKHNNSSVIHE